MDDVIVRDAATTLAITLFELIQDPCFRDLRQSGLIKRTVNPDFEDLTSKSFQFPSARLLVLLCQHWELSIMICGCIQRLEKLPPLAHQGCHLPYLSGKVEQTEMQAARYIIMSLEQMCNLGERCPTVQLRLIFPAQLVFAAFSRLEKRERMMATTTEVQASIEANVIVDHARTVQTLCLELQNRCAIGWHPGVATYREFS